VFRNTKEYLLRRSGGGVQGISWNSLFGKELTAEDVERFVLGAGVEYPVRDLWILQLSLYCCDQPANAWETPAVSW
jgi:hypothetical protein